MTPFGDPIQLGESFVGDGVNAAHINTVLGRAGSGAETAWATALATPRAGFAPFVTILQPGIPVKPFTLFVNKAAIEGDTHGTITWGAAQAGVAAGVADAVVAGIIPEAEVDDLRIIAAVWVNPAANDEHAVFRNNREATRTALVNGANRLPETADVLAALEHPHNPFYAGQR